MDTFFEQIIVRKRSIAEKISAGLMGFFGVLLIFLLLTTAFLRLMGAISVLFVPLAFGAGFLLYYLFGTMYVEFEYSITNGAFDIDKIIGKKKRQRMLTTNCRDFEEFGIYDKSKAEQLKQRDFDAKVLSANLKDENLYYGVVNHKNLGRVLVVIEPDDRIKKALKKFLPRNVQGRIFENQNFYED